MPRYEPQATHISLFFLIFFIIHTSYYTNQLQTFDRAAALCYHLHRRRHSNRRLVKALLPSSIAALPLHYNCTCSLSLSLSLSFFNRQQVLGWFFWKRPRYFTQSSTCMNMVEQQQYITAGLPHTGDLAGSHSLSDDRSIVSVGTPTYSEVTPFSAVSISRLSPENLALCFVALLLFSPLSCPASCNGCRLTNRVFFSHRSLLSTSLLRATRAFLLPSPPPALPRSSRSVN